MALLKQGRTDVPKLHRLGTILVTFVAAWTTVARCVQKGPVTGPNLNWLLLGRICILPRNRLHPLKIPGYIILLRLAELLLALSLQPTCYAAFLRSTSLGTV